MTNNKRQTAVEWLWEIAYNRELTVQDWKQAKEMEKQRMIEFTNEWFEEYQCGLDNFKNPEQYYNETYGGGNK